MQRRKRKASSGVDVAVAAAGGQPGREPSPPPQPLPQTRRRRGQPTRQAPPQPPLLPAPDVQGPPPPPPVPVAYAQAPPPPVPVAYAQASAPPEDGVTALLLEMRADIRGYQQRQDRLEETVRGLQASIAAVTNVAGPGPSQHILLDNGPAPTSNQANSLPLGPATPLEQSLSNLHNVPGPHDSQPSTSHAGLHPGALRLAEEMMGVPPAGTGEPGRVRVGARPGGAPRRAPGKGVPVDLYVKNELRERILSHEYIDFALLLPKKQKSGGSWLFASVEEGYSVSHFPETHKEALEINQWRDAWLIYSTVLIKEYPEMVEDLNQHAQTVFELQDAGRDWASYDSGFLEYEEELGVRGKNVKEKISEFFGIVQVC